MIRYLLDTDHISLLERGHSAVCARVATTPPDQLATSAVTVEEMLRGRLAVLAQPLDGPARTHAYLKLLETVNFCASASVIQYDSACETEYQRLRSLRVRIGSQDLRIASTALAHRLIVITRNRHDFGRVPGLPMEDWSVQ